MAGHVSPPLKSKRKLLAKIDKLSKGAVKRHRPDDEFRLKVYARIGELERANMDAKDAQALLAAGGMPNLLMKEFPVLTAPQISRWRKKENKREFLAKVASINPNRKGGRRRKNLLKRKAGGGAPVWFPTEEREVLLEITNRRAKGFKVKSRWVRALMKRKVRLSTSKRAQRFKATSTWLDGFMRRSGLSWRRKTNSKPFIATDFQPKVVRRIDHLKMVRLTSIPDDNVDVDLTLDKLFGLYPPNRTFNVDQVPLPFVVDNEITMDFTGTKRVWVKQMGSGLDKRQATLQLLIRGQGEQPKPCLIFRGKPGRGSKARQEEVKLYDSDVTVIWQKKAWADTDVCVDWATHEYGSFAPSDFASGVAEPKLLIVDNLNGQVAKPFIQALNSTNTILRMGVPGATDIWQPVDAGVGKQYKFLISEYYDEWLTSDEAAPYLSSGTIPIHIRRILLTQWVGRAYRELEQRRVMAEEGEDIFYKAFLRTGALVTRTGDYDDMIRPQGLPDTFHQSLTPISSLNVQDQPQWSEPDSDEAPQTAHPSDRKTQPRQHYHHQRERVERVVFNNVSHIRGLLKKDLEDQCYAYGLSVVAGAKKPELVEILRTHVLDAAHVPHTVVGQSTSSTVSGSTCTSLHNYSDRAIDEKQEHDYGHDCSCDSDSDSDSDSSENDYDSVSQNDSGSSDIDSDSDVSDEHEEAEGDEQEGDQGKELCLDEGSGFLAAEVLDRRELLRHLRQSMYQPKQL